MKDETISSNVSEIKSDVKEVKTDVKVLGKAPAMQASVSPTTTVEQDLRTAGQRKINLIWEDTQRVIALFVVGVACTVSAYVVVLAVSKGQETNALVLAAFTLLSNIGFLVAGFYFGRTNHARIGDDPKPMDDRNWNPKP